MFKSVPDFVPLLLQALLGWSGMQFLELDINPEYFTQEREIAQAAKEAQSQTFSRSFYLRRQEKKAPAIQEQEAEAAVKLQAVIRGRSTRKGSLDKLFPATQEGSAAREEKARASVSVREQCLHAYHIPATKHMLSIVTTTVHPFTTSAQALVPTP